MNISYGMRRAILSIILVSGCAGESGIRSKFILYDGFETDLHLIRTQDVTKQKVGGIDLRTSSGEACIAAARIFMRVSFLFRTKAEILELLGDPATISDYNKPANINDYSPIIYRFDTGYFGTEYYIAFDKQGAAVQIRATVLE